MAFHRDKAAALEWKRWLSRNRAALVACGLPEEVYADRRTWLYFLGHAGLSDSTTGFRFSLSMLSREQMQRLYDFVLADYPAATEYDPWLVAVLRAELGISRPGGCT